MKRFLCGMMTCLVAACALTFTGCGGESGKIIPASEDFKPNMDDPASFAPPGTPGSLDANGNVIAPGGAEIPGAAPPTK